MTRRGLLGLLLGAPLVAQAGLKASAPQGFSAQQYLTKAYFDFMKRSGGKWGGPKAIYCSEWFYEKFCSEVPVLKHLSNDALSVMVEKPESGRKLLFKDTILTPMMGLKDKDLALVGHPYGATTMVKG